jgi:type II secretory pathway pseudopilin PulG
MTMLISRPIRRQRKRRHGESGYSLLMVVFMVATLLILSSAVVPSVLTQGRREREEETIWRGEQYARAIRLYFQKLGRYPTKIDDLTKQTNGVRFLRQAYSDPMNKEDGSWRFIYVGPNGQLIGSLRSQSLMQSVVNAFALTGASPLGQGAAPPPPPPPPGATTGVGATGVGQTSQQPGQQTSGGLAPISSEPQPQPLTGAVIGGNITGVGSKSKESSLRVYEGGDTYEQWEFIWNPVLQGGIPGQSGPVNPNAPPAPGQPSPQNQQAPPGMQPLQTPPGFGNGGSPGTMRQ